MLLEPRIVPSPAAERWTNRFTRWDAALAGCLALLAASALLSIRMAATGHGEGLAAAAGAPPSAWNIGLTFAITGGVPFIWLLRTRARPLAGALDYLRLRNLRRAAPFGLAVGVAMALLVMLVLQTTPGPPPPFAVLLNAAFFWVFLGPLGEEILFRGILQPRIGIVAQAGAFTVLHIAAVTPIQAVLVLGCGVALGVTAHRWGLWASIVAHATYNLVALL